MQILDGTLAVEVIKGNRGDFCVGTLTTSIGEFKVKDAALEQFERVHREHSLAWWLVYQPHGQDCNRWLSDQRRRHQLNERTQCAS